MGMLVSSSLTLMVTALCAVTVVTGYSLMTSCIRDVSECPDDVTAQYPVCGNCSVFILCAGASTSGLLDCPGDLVYDRNLGVCQYSSLANTTFCRHIPDCITSCDGLPENLYPSCRDCHHYFSCFTPDSGERLCLDGKEWDNSADVLACATSSNTCPRSQIS